MTAAGAERRTRRWPVLARRATQLAACLLLAWGGFRVQRTDPPMPALLSQRLLPAPDRSAGLLAISETPQPAPGLSTAEVTVRRNDTLDAIFRRLALDRGDLAALRAQVTLRPVLDRLVPGETLRFQHRDGRLYRLQRDVSLTERLDVRRVADGLRSRIVARPIERRATLTHGVIHASLFEDGAAAGLGDPTILEVARIFGWDIDFVLDLRDGDEFLVYYERIYQGGHFLQDGDILAARFVNQGREYRAVRFVAPDGRARYYTPDGRSMEKAFLRAPLEFRRISSRFSLGRYHPILNRIRAHKGIDYAAPGGTPVRAAGDGTVRFRGWRGGYGNVIELQHGGGITTVYGHLSRFAARSAASRSVRQGEIIGYVGMTGLATGPHLHYEYRVNGQFRNPATVQLPEATPIDPALRGLFLQQTAPLLQARAPALVPAPATAASALPAAPATR
ncbi:MAG: peptidoglycan DD-metalloendopeptidase family protein [Gammaproteobacteria bacterium]|nr:peptidoglycan DD-metalloendopeptidase family protein [Gammaproteobacteria bacterium]